MKAMGSNLHVQRLAALLVAALLWALSSGAHGAKKAAPDPAVVADFASVRALVERIGREALSPGLWKSFVSKLDAAEAAYVRSQPCTAVNVLSALIHQTDGLRHGKQVAVAERVRNLGWELRDAVLQGLPVGMSCPGFERAGKTPEVTILASDNRRFAASVGFGLPSLSTEAGGDEIWTQVSLPSVPSHMNEPGTPGVPFWHALVAVPSGATPRLGRIGVEVGDVLWVNLYPGQYQETDPPQNQEIQSPGRPPFVKDEDLYATDAFYPADPCVVTPLGSSRDLQLAQISCAAGQYNPVSNELRLFSSVTFDIAFEGGEGTFLTTRSLGPFEPPARVPLMSAVNGEAVTKYVKTVAAPVDSCEGEELLILTHGDFYHEAVRLADWKRRKGIATNVFVVNDSPAYDTGEEIDAFIERRYDNCSIRPSYVLLFGDSELVPPSRTDYDTTPYMGDIGDETTGSDYGYALYATSLLDILPDFAVGRIPVDEADEARTVVDKIINYESSPPFVDLHSGSPFYTTTTHASSFECCRMHEDGSPLGYDGRDQRNFIETSELVRDRLMKLGYTVERVYAMTVDLGGNCVDERDPCTRQQPYNGDDTPDRYHNGRRLPADLRSGSGFGWSGDTNDIDDAFTEGRFLVLHRDHGRIDAWSHPYYSSQYYARSLTNGDLLPFIYSINCSSGYFDYESDHDGTEYESLMEVFLRNPKGGAVATIASNRVSPTWANSVLTRGLYDATWPGVVPDFGGNQSTRRLGDILNHGKIYLLTQIGVAQRSGKEIGLGVALTELILFHALGDPTLEMWTSNPHRASLSAECVLDARDDVMEVGYGVEGATITALQMLQTAQAPGTEQKQQGVVYAVGRARVENGVARISYFRPPLAGVPIMLSAGYENMVSIRLIPTNQLP